MRPTTSPCHRIGSLNSVHSSRFDRQYGRQNLESRPHVGSRSMSGGEFLLTLVAVALGPVAWALWLVGARSAQGLRRGAGLHVIAAAVTVSALLLVGVLKTVASFD